MPEPAKLSVKKIPFFKLIVCLIIGTIFQWYLAITLRSIIIFTSLDIVSLFVFYLLPLSKKFVLRWMQGALILLLFFYAGMFITWQQNLHNDTKWYGKVYKPGDAVLITINEPLVAKINSYKALAEINAVYKNNTWISSTGNVLLYFKKDS